MKKVAIIYWSGTGNTEKMADLIEQGFKESINHQKIELSCKSVSDASWKDLESVDLILLGCPAMGVEELEDSEMQPFLEKTADSYQDKALALFGSYGWGDGEWMENWQNMMNSYGAKQVIDSLMIQEMPEGASEELCLQFGRRLAETL